MFRELIDDIHNVLIFLFSADSLATDPKTGFPLFQPMIPIRMTSSLSPGRGRDKGRDCKSLSPKRERGIEIETEKSKDSNAVGKSFDRSKNNFNNFSSTLEYPGNRNLKIQIPSEVSVPKGIRRRPSEVYRDMIRKDEERQDRVRRAQLEAEVLPSFVHFYFVIYLFIFRFIYLFVYLFICFSVSICMLYLSSYYLPFKYEHYVLLILLYVISQYFVNRFILCTAEMFF